MLHFIIPVGATTPIHNLFFHNQSLSFGPLLVQIQSRILILLQGPTQVNRLNHKSNLKNQNNF